MKSVIELYKTSVQPKLSSFQKGQVTQMELDPYSHMIRPINTLLCHKAKPTNFIITFYIYFFYILKSIHFHVVIYTGIIHGDKNHQNVIVRSIDDDGIYEVSRILDFNLLSIDCTLFELVSPIMYNMLKSPHPMDVGGAMLAG